MNKKGSFGLIILSCFALALPYGCSQQPDPPRPVPVSEPHPEHTYYVTGSIHEMNLGHETITFPDLAGKQEFVSYCGICHSLKYITAQPDFSRKTWDAEVTKMVVKYHAPIDSAKCRKIVDYLVAIKGKP